MAVSRLAKGPTLPAQRQHDASNCARCAVTAVTHHCPWPCPHPPPASLPRLAHLLRGSESATTWHTQLPPPPTWTQCGEMAARLCALCRFTLVFTLTLSLSSLPLPSPTDPHRVCRNDSTTCSAILPSPSPLQLAPLACSLSFPPTHP
jgi:hypothetical protein